MKSYPWTGILFFLLFSQTLLAREVLDLSNEKWLLNLDPQAAWVNDTLYLPGQWSLTTLPVHPPTFGWEPAYHSGQAVSIPATVEGHLWGYNGSTFGVTGNYVGVSWFT
jgi:hypothetical protein